MQPNPIESRPPHAPSPLPLGPAHSLLVHSEVVRDFMPDRISQHLLQLCSRARQAFVWTLENCDLIRHGEPFEDGPVRQRPIMLVNGA